MPEIDAKLSKRMPVAPSTADGAQLLAQLDIIGKQLDNAVDLAMKMGLDENCSKLEKASFGRLIGLFEQMCEAGPVTQETIGAHNVMIGRISERLHLTLQMEGVKAYIRTLKQEKSSWKQKFKAWREKTRDD